MTVYYGLYSWDPRRIASVPACSAILAGKLARPRRNDVTVRMKIDREVFVPCLYEFETKGLEASVRQELKRNDSQHNDGDAGVSLVELNGRHKQRHADLGRIIKAFTRGKKAYQVIYLRRNVITRVSVFCPCLSVRDLSIRSTTISNCILLTDHHISWPKIIRS